MLPKTRVFENAIVSDSFGKRCFMDKKLEKTNADKVKRKVAVLLKDYGFSRTKPTFYTKLLNDRIEFVHLHKFTFGPFFRVHMGIRFLCDEFEAAALNGPDSDSYKYANKNIIMAYSSKEESMDRCAVEILNFVKQVGFTWFEKWRKSEVILSSPISHDETRLLEAYRKSLIGDLDEQISNNSLRILGIRKNN